MKRIPEPELMIQPEQVKAYAQANFDEPHSNFIKIFKAKFSDQNINGKVLDLGCGPGDITFRFAEVFPGTEIHAIDGSSEMINYASDLLLNKPGFENRIKFVNSRIENFQSNEKYDYIISNSLLHHLHDPAVFWNGISKFARDDSIVFVMDLVRPDSINSVEQLVKKYSGDEPNILKKDFKNSLLAAFGIEEVELQLEKARLDFTVSQVSDRHFAVYGRF